MSLSLGRGGQGRIEIVQRYFATFVLAAAAFLLLPAFASAAVPSGHLDYAGSDAIFGWAYDADAPGSAVEVHIYVDGVPTVSVMANQDRQDLVAAGVAPTPNHGFGWVPEGIGAGTHVIEAYAINIGGGANPLLGSRTITTGSQLPRGTLDFATPGLVSGWAYDADAGEAPVEVHIYIDGVHRGTVLANDERGDLVPAGAATDPWHGFTWNPPVLPPGEHTVSAWAINAGGGGNPELHNSPQTMNVCSCRHEGVAYLDNGVVRVGANLSWGGAITEVSHGGHNMIDEHDTGRLLQASLYDDGETYAGFDNWGWNAVQGGDKHNHGSTVSEYTNNGTTIYTKTDMLEWNPDGKGGGVLSGVSAGATLEQWISLDPAIPERVSVRYRVTTDQGRTGNHELPALFTADWLPNLVTYQGNNPWSYQPLTTLSVPEHPALAEIHDLFEYWAAWTNDSGFGLAISFPQHNRGTSANANRSDRAFNYFRPGITDTVGPNNPIDITYDIIIGNVDDSRGIIYSLATP